MQQRQMMEEQHNQNYNQQIVLSNLMGTSIKMTEKDVPSNRKPKKSKTRALQESPEEKEERIGHLSLENSLLLNQITEEVKNNKMRERR